MVISPLKNSPLTNPGVLHKSHDLATETAEKACGTQTGLQKSSALASSEVDVGLAALLPA